MLLAVTEDMPAHPLLARRYCDFELRVAVSQKWGDLQHDLHVGEVGVGRLENEAGVLPHRPDTCRFKVRPSVPKESLRARPLVKDDTLPEPRGVVGLAK